MINFEVPDLYVKDFRNDFKERHGSLLHALETAEKEHSVVIPAKKGKKEKPEHRGSQRAITKSYRGKESIFKTPEVPLLQMKCKKFYKKSSSPKWLKYSLNDVTSEDMSDSTNTKTAFSFLRELEERKRKQEAADSESDAGFKPIFKKPELTKVDDEESKVFKNEYQVGKKFIKKKITDVRGTSDNENNKVKLSHLEDEDE